MNKGGSGANSSTKDDTANCDYTSHELVVENGKSTCVAKCGAGTTRNYSTGSCDPSNDPSLCLAGANADGSCKSSGLESSVTAATVACPAGTTLVDTKCVVTPVSSGTGRTNSTNLPGGDPSSSSGGGFSANASLDTGSSAATGRSASTGSGAAKGSGASGLGGGGAGSRTASTAGGSGVGGGGAAGYSSSGSGGVGGSSEGGVAGSITSDNLVPDDEVFTGANGQRYVRRYVNGQWGNYVIFDQSKSVRASVRSNALNDAMAPRSPAPSPRR